MSERGWLRATLSIGSGGTTYNYTTVQLYNCSVGSPKASTETLPELFQTEWCPSSRRVRQRLTELSVSVVIHQVAVEREERTDLLARTGVTTIPVLVDETGAVHVGETDIVEYLDAHHPEPEGAEAHRLKAIKARERELQEATRWLEPATH